MVFNSLIFLIPGDEQAVPNYTKRKCNSHPSQRNKKRRLENVTCGVKGKVIIISYLFLEIVIETNMAYLQCTEMPLFSYSFMSVFFRITYIDIILVFVPPVVAGKVL